jgi:superfamily II DNA/RNA helicase
LLDRIQRGLLPISDVKHLIFDEIDESLSRGFGDQIYDILALFPRPEALPSTDGVSAPPSGQDVDPLSTVCLGFLSSTIPGELFELCERVQREPVIRIKSFPPPPSIDSCRQFYLDCEREEWKFDILLDLLEVISGTQQLVVYCNTRRCVMKNEQWG